jgi:hypothetical protein
MAITACICFYNNGEAVALGVDLAAAELARAGYVVHRRPPEQFERVRFDAPGDSGFLGAVIECPDDDKVIKAILDEVSGVVWKHEGDVTEWGPIEDGYVPFSDDEQGYRQ